MALEILFLPLIILIFLAIIALAVLITAFWIWMIIDCAQRKFKNDNERVIWILVIVLASWLGALIYYFVIKRAKPKRVQKA